MTKRVLIVDDSRFARVLVRETLRSLLPDCEVVEAGSGDDAVRICAELRPDLITMDFNMPGIDGIEASAQILRELPDVPICLLTANTQAKVRERAEELGIRCANKPVTEDVLREWLGS